MKKIAVIIVAGGLIGLAFITNTKPNKPGAPGSPIHGEYSPIAVLELFTSEGCSSCPPADRLLPMLTKLDSNIISLSFHVDYWNRLGWVDPFSNSLFSDRQREYNHQLGADGSYTPQLIVNGQYELVGSSRTDATAAIKKALSQKSSVQLSVSAAEIKDNSIVIKSKANGDISNSELQIALVQKVAVNDINGGENAGIRLTHSNVVRVFQKQTTATENEFRLPLPQDIRKGEYQLVLYARQKKDLKITGAVVYTPK